MSLKPGTQLGHYEVTGPLGSGGMGRVYRARDTRLHREVAIKLMSEVTASDRSAAERFFREALAASALNHPNIITVFEFIESNSGPLLVMELIDGKTLRQLIVERPSLPTALDWCRQMARALSAAHGCGIVHRDLKPENIMVRHDGYLKVLDFGIARLTRSRVGQECDGTLTGTTPGMLLGTARYMSPEQVRGEAAGAASDVFSLGLVWFELLTGQHPFRADTSSATMSAIAFGEPMRPSAVIPEISGPLEALLLRMLHKQPELRPDPQELERFLSDSDIRPVELSGAGSASPSTVGRDEELKALRMAYDKIARGEAGRLMCVAGEAGIGKTTLADRFLQDLQRSSEIVLIGRGRCSERLAGTEAYLPFLESLDSLLRSHSDLPARLMKQHAPLWYVQVASTTQVDPAATRVDEARTTSQERLKRELHTFLRELSAIRPVILFFDDLHWADASTIDLLNHAANQFASMRLLIIVTYRPSDMIIAKHPFVPVRLSLQGRGLCTELVLDFLTCDEVEKYVALTFPGHSFPSVFPAMLHARTEGNPLFVADLLRYLRDRGTIGESSGRWMLTEAFDGIAGDLPASVRSMVERKIEQLSEDDRKLLAAGSVQGYEFDSAVVAEVLQLDPADVEERLNLLDKVQSFVRLVNEEELPDRTLSVRYRFVHVLYQNALYASLRPTRRAALSSAVAASMETHMVGGESIAAELAFLFESARKPEKAASYFLIAARNAASFFAWGEAAALAKRGLESVKILPPSEFRLNTNLELEVTLAFALRVSKGNAAPETGGSMLRARELSERAGNAQYVPALLWGLWLYHQVGGDLATARHFGEQSLTLGNQTGDPEVFMGAHTALGITAVHMGDLVTGHNHLEQAVTFHIPSQHPAYVARYNLDPGVYAAPGTQRTLWLLGYPDQARKRTLQTLEWIHQFSDPQSIAFVHVFAAFFYQYCREPLEVTRLADACIALCAEHGIVQEREWIAPVRGWALAKQGRFEEGIEFLRESLARHRAIQSQLNVPYFLTLLAELLLQSRQLDQGLEAVEEALQVVERTQQRSFLAEIYRLKGELVLAGDADDPIAKDLLRRALDISEAQSARSLQLRAATSLFRSQVRKVEEQEAREILQRVYDTFTEGFSTPDLRDARALLDGGRD